MKKPIPKEPKLSKNGKRLGRPPKVTTEPQPVTITPPDEEQLW